VGAVDNRKEQAQMAISMGYSPMGRASAGSRSLSTNSSVMGKPSTSGRGKYPTYGAGGGHVGKARPGGGTGGKGGKSASYAVPKNKLR